MSLVRLVYGTNTYGLWGWYVYKWLWVVIDDQMRRSGHSDAGQRFSYTVYLVYISDCLIAKHSVVVSYIMFFLSIL